MIFPDGAKRVLKFLSTGPASVRPSAVSASVLLEADGRGTISAKSELIQLLASEGVVVRASHSVALTGSGAAFARRLAGATGNVPTHHRDLDLITVGGESGPVLANMAESPLAQLMRRKTKSGSAFLATSEFEAGERLRADYTRGQLMPRLGANWVASVSSGRRASGGGAVELTDAALGARQRVEKAISAVGPELSGVLIDVCCFLKGLETVEMERGWPVRSAKVMLKTALGVLARHYSPSQHGRQRHVLHWGAANYRPSIDGPAA